MVETKHVMHEIRKAPILIDIGDGQFLMIKHVAKKELATMKSVAPGNLDLKK